MFKNPEYEYNGVAFKSDPKLKDSTVDIFSYTNKSTGKVNYSTERKAWGLYKPGDYEQSRTSLFSVHKEAINGYSPIYQVQR